MIEGAGATCSAGTKQALFVRVCERPADVVPFGEHSNVRLNPSPETKAAQNCAKGRDFEIDRSGRCFGDPPLLLISRYVRCLNVGAENSSENR